MISNNWVDIFLWIDFGVTKKKEKTLDNRKKTMWWGQIRGG